MKSDKIGFALVRGAVESGHGSALCSENEVQPLCSEIETVRSRPPTDLPPSVKKEAKEDEERYDKHVRPPVSIHNFNDGRI